MTYTPRIHIRVGAATYLPEIHGLRGLAITLVFLGHANGIITFGHGQHGAAVSPPMALVAGGHTGVTLFFVISAFLLSLPIFAAAGGHRWSLRDYFAHRALRILPLYYVAVLIAAIATAQQPRDVLQALPWAAFSNAVGYAVPLLPYSSVWWSLATEVEFYLLLPLLFVGVRWRWGTAGAAGFFVVYAVAYAAFIHGTLHAPTVEGQLLLCLSVFGRGSAFLFGIAVAWIYHRYGLKLQAWGATRKWIGYGGADATLVLCFSILAWLLQKVVLLGFWGAETQWPIWHVGEAAVWAAIMLLLLSMPLRAKWLIANRLLGYVGTISYSIYLSHQPLLELSFGALRRLFPGALVGWTAPSVIALAALSGVGMAFASLTYAFIERPFLVRKEMLHSVRSGRDVRHDHARQG